ncbi:Vacuolar basic amino acid transporter 5 [Madurella mycetomatis]|uniref:Vacuolar basic amino acid transporter 5 n=1 Tax=Madurella mycetomatis TaxID=100816 RepID=A0A175WA87_9PEZI|nr:Vacuolar basic amino acid transporter 5 [Madurella mycetomatis]
MYLAVRYAKKQYRAYQDRKADQHQLQVSLAGAHTQDAARFEDTAALTAPPTSASQAVDNSGGTKDAERKETPEERAEKKRRRRYRLKIILGLFAPYTLQALDTTIIASALKFIADDFSQFPPSSFSSFLTKVKERRRKADNSGTRADERHQLNWIITVFNLTSAAFLPVFSQLADVFGRHAALQTAVVTLTLGSALCTAAPTSAFPLLLLGRALQGVGAAGVNICVRTILADRVPLAEYAKNWAVFALLSAASFSVGPVLGGYLTQVSWRWCFAVNLPVGVAAVGLVVWLLKGELVPAQGVDEGLFGSRSGGTMMERFWARLATVDYGGQVLFLLGLGLLVLAFTWGGSMFPWDSAAVLVSLVVGGVLTVAWVVYEWAMVPGRAMAKAFPRQKAMMPWQLLMQRDIGLLFLVNFAIGVATFSVMYFMDLYFTLVLGHSASRAGLALLFFLPGLGGGVYMAMFFINVWPRQTFPALLIGSVSSAVGITVLPWACQSANTPLIYGMMALAGYGVGMNTNPGSLHGLAYFPDMTAPISCLVSFAVPFGGTIALTIMSTVFNNKSGQNHEDPRSGIVWAFIAMIPIMWAGVLVTTFLGNVWIRKDGSHEVVHGAWVWSLVGGKSLRKVMMARAEDAGPNDDNSDVPLGAVGPSMPVAETDIDRARYPRGVYGRMALSV